MNLKQNIRLKNLVKYKNLSDKQNILCLKTNYDVNKKNMKHWCNDFFEDNTVIKINSITKNKKRRINFWKNKDKKFLKTKIQKKKYKIFIIKFKNNIDLNLFKKSQQIKDMPTSKTISSLKKTLKKNKKIIKDEKK